VNFYVLIYDQSSGRLRDVEHYGVDGAMAALARRFELDRQYAGEPSVEIVLLSAESEDALRQTHARYFSSVNQLAQKSVDDLARAG